MGGDHVPRSTPSAVRVDGPSEGPGRDERRVRGGRCRVRRVAAAIPACAVLAFGAACTATVEVGLTTERNGSGLVSVTARLDPAAARLADRAKVTPRVDDLAATGWVVSAPQPQADGSLVYSARRPVANTAEAEAALAQLGAPFAGLKVSRSHTLARTRTRVSGQVNLSEGIETFGDDVVRERLGSTSRIGVDAAELQRQAGRPIAEILQFRVRAQVPGAPPTSWAPALGATTPIDLGGSVGHPGVLLRLAAGALTLLGAVALAAAQLRVRRRRARRWGAA